jgi:hypothetical protein
MASLGDELLGVVNKLQDLVFNTIGTPRRKASTVGKHATTRLTNI